MAAKVLHIAARLVSFANCVKSLLHLKLLVAIEPPPAPKQIPERADLIFLRLAVREPLCNKSGVKGLEVFVFLAPEHDLLRICTMLSALRFERDFDIPFILAVTSAQFNAPSQQGYKGTDVSVTRFAMAEITRPP